MATDNEDGLFNSFARYQCAQAPSPWCTPAHEVVRRYWFHSWKSSDEIM